VTLGFGTIGATPGRSGSHPASEPTQLRVTGSKSARVMRGFGAVRITPGSEPAFVTTGFETVRITRDFGTGPRATAQPARATRLGNRRSMGPIRDAGVLHSACEVFREFRFVAKANA
jgi:hypothetical protein